MLFGVVAAMVLSGGSASADFTFGEPVRVASGLTGMDFIACLSYDELEMYIASTRAGGQGLVDLWVLKRASVDDDWGPPQNLGPAVNSPSYEFLASISADGLTLYFDSDRPYEDAIRLNIYMTTRATKNDPWGPAVKMGPEINGPGNVSEVPWISPDGLELYFDSWRSGGYGALDLYVARRATVNDPWGNAVNLGPVVNSPYDEEWPSLSPDGLLLLFSGMWIEPSSPRPGGYGSSDLWMTRRASLSDPWQPPVNLGSKVNKPSNDAVPRISPDGRTLYFVVSSTEAWQAPIIPIVDFNGDGIVDSADVCIMVDHWGTDEPMCDIGPMPWGDGIVDVQDLIILAEHLFEEVNDPTLIAHWGLDETEGMVVTDSAGDNNGYALGEPIWQPNSGQVKGALQLDGVDDYVVTGMAPSPEKESYSVLAWIKGGAPGQVVLSQMGKANWLYTDPSTGALMTELTMAGRNSCSLASEAVITDGNWHRIGFVWDGYYRRLYVDGVVVAEDVQDNLDISVNGLYIGTGKAMGAGTYWSGLIDDVRIYNRAVIP